MRNEKGELDFWGRFGMVFAFLIGGLFWWGLASFMASCSAPPPISATKSAPPPWEPPPLRQVSLAVPTEEELVTGGRIRLLHGDTACRPRRGVNPYVHFGKGRPKVGVPLVIEFVSRHGGDAPDEPMWVIASFVKLEPALAMEPWGMRGCRLLVEPQSLVSVPAGVHGLFRREQGTGNVRFEWTPPTWAAGTHFYMQLLVASPREMQGGFLVSPAVEVLIGQ